MQWPTTPEDLARAQDELASLLPPPWQPGDEPPLIGGCFAAFPRGTSGPGRAGDRAWAAAVAMRAGAVEATSVVKGLAGASYKPGLLALREGPLLEAAVQALAAPPEVLLVNATGRDHPRGCGLAMHLGALLSLPSVGVTHRPLMASGDWPTDEPGSASPLRLEGKLVGFWLRPSKGTRPLAVHAGWCTSPETALEVVRRSLVGSGTPAPLRRARELARLARERADR